MAHESEALGFASQAAAVLVASARSAPTLLAVAVLECVLAAAAVPPAAAAVPAAAAREAGRDVGVAELLLVRAQLVRLRVARAGHVARVDRVRGHLDRLLGVADERHERGALGAQLGVVRRARAEPAPRQLLAEDQVDHRREDVQVRGDHVRVDARVGHARHADEQRCARVEVEVGVLRPQPWYGVRVGVGSRGWVRAGAKVGGRAGHDRRRRGDAAAQSSRIWRR